MTRSMLFAAGVAVALVGWPAISTAQGTKSADPAPQSPAMPAPSAKAPGADHFAGTWTYDADNSVDAVSGKQEQPNSNTPRRGTANGKPTGGSTGGSTSPNNPNNPNNPGGYPGYPGSYPGGYGPGGYGNGYGSGGYGGMFPPTPMGLTGIEVNEQRELVRDLMEIPQTLTIAVAGDTVTFKDDLDRTLTFTTNNKKQHYQLGAASFDAHARWEGPQLIVEIEGANGFRLSETFFLSEEANRLFAIYRLGDPKKQRDTPLTGVNRVYNRGTSSR